MSIGHRDHLPADVDLELRVRVVFEIVEVMLPALLWRERLDAKVVRECPLRARRSV